MDESLFTTRQLTEYRRWPDGRKGCLFYIPDHSWANGPTRGAIYILNSPWRKEDEIGEFNQLHQIESKALDDAHCIIRGFGALLYSLKWKKNDIVRAKELWNQYCEWIYQDYTEIPSAILNLYWECSNWSARKRKVLNAFHEDYVGRIAIESLYRDVFVNDLMTKYASVDAQMWKTSPVIRIPNTKNATYQILKHNIKNKKTLKRFEKKLSTLFPIDYYYLQYNFENEQLELTHEENTFFYYVKEHDSLTPSMTELVSEPMGNGFAALFLNYLMTHHILEYINREEDIDVCVQLLWGTFIAETPPLTFNDLDFSFSGLNSKQVYDCYIKRRMIDIDSLCKTASSDSLDSEQTKKWKRYSILFSAELELYDVENKIIEYLSPEQGNILLSYTRDFFRYVLTFIKGSPYEQDCMSVYNELFEDEGLGNILEESEIDVPQEKDRFRYVKLVKWLKVQKELGNDYLADAGNNRSLMCRNLKKILGWLPDQGALRKAQERN